MALQDTDLFLVQRASASYKMSATDLSEYVGGGNSSVTVSASAPSAPENGDMWWNSEDGNLYIYYTDADSSQWVPSIAENGGFINATVSPNVPSNASEGDLWYSESDTRLYIYDGSVWIDASPASAPNISTISASAPSTPASGDLWYDLDSARLYVYDGSQWVDSAPGYGIQDGAVGTSQLADDSVTAAKVDASVLANNVIINGAMQVAQRGTNFTGVTTGPSYAADRWRWQGVDVGTWETSQSADAPTSSGFSKSFKAECTSGNGSQVATTFAVIRTVIEGQDLQQFAKGTSGAKNFALSFWVKSSVAGTYSIYLYDNDNSREISIDYTINSATTWEYKTVVIDRDTVGTFANDNGDSLYVSFFLGAGSDYDSGLFNSTWQSENASGRASSSHAQLNTTGNQFWITGVQLTATNEPLPFQHEDYGTTLRKCQRYYQTMPRIYLGEMHNSAIKRGVWMLSPQMRATPSVTFDSVGSSAVSLLSGETNSQQVILSSNYTGGMSISDINTADAEL